MGITGGIGAGKSVVCRFFAAQGIPVYDADTRAKWISHHDPEVVTAVKAAFGPEAYLESGGLNRAYLAEEVFNKGRAAELNAIVHPRVATDFARWTASHATAPYLVYEAALMIESGSYLKMDTVLTVSAPEQLRIDRVLKRDPQRSREQIAAIIAKQLPEEARQAKADLVIWNDERYSLIEKLLTLHQRLLKEKE